MPLFLLQYPRIYGPGLDVPRQRVAVVGADLPIEDAEALLVGFERIDHTLHVRYRGLRQSRMHCEQHFLQRGVAFGVQRDTEVLRLMSQYQRQELGQLYELLRCHRRFAAFQASALSSRCSRNWRAAGGRALSRWNRKAEHCAALGITHFIDDRTDVLEAMRGVVPNRYLFGPQHRLVPSGLTPAASWRRVAELLL